MRILFVALLAVSCATAAPNRYDYKESATCEQPMTDEAHASGQVRCVAMCSSYGRDFAKYTSDCKCWCKEGYHGGYRPQAPITSQM